MIEPLQRTFQSQTWAELRVLLSELSPARRRFLGLVLICSFFQGLLDIFLVGLLARLVGLLAGARLGDQIPGFSEVVGKVLLKSLTTVELLHGNRTNNRVFRQLADFLFHRSVNEIEVGHELAIAGLVDDTLEEAADEAGVLGHRVSLFGAFTKLSGQGYGHWDQATTFRKTL